MASPAKETDDFKIPFSSSISFKDTNPLASLAGRTVSSAPSDNRDLQNQVRKLSETVNELLPFFKNRILDLEKEVVDQKQQLNNIQNNVNSHFTTISSQNAMLQTTILTVLSGVQDNLKNLSEQADENGTKIKEFQEQQKAFLETLLPEGTKAKK